MSKPETAQEAEQTLAGLKTSARAAGPSGPHVMSALPPRADIG